MNKAEVTKMAAIRTKSSKVLEAKQISNLQEIIRRVKASSQMAVLDPIIHRKLAQLSEN
jgi:hypothetical protein